MDHPNVIKPLEIDFKTELAIVYEHWELSLAQWISKMASDEENDIPHHDIIIIMQQILGALKCMNQSKIVFKTLSPKSIVFLDQSSLLSLRIVNFENAVVQKRINPSLSRVQDVFKSAKCDMPKVELKEILSNKKDELPKSLYDSQVIEYVAPEIIAGKEYDCKADIYSAGIIFYQLLVLCSDIMDSSANAGTMPIDWLPEQDIGSSQSENLDFSLIPEMYRSLVQKMLHQNPESRPEIESIIETLDQSGERYTESFIERQVWISIFVESEEELKWHQAIFVRQLFYRYYLNQQLREDVETNVLTKAYAKITGTQGNGSVVCVNDVGTLNKLHNAALRSWEGFIRFRKTSSHPPYHRKFVKKYMTDIYKSTDYENKDIILKTVLSFNNI